MGILDDDDLEFIKQAREEANKFKPQELNEVNVQAIFNRCIAKEGTPEEQCFNSILFSRLRGYNPDTERIVVFNRENFLANKKIFNTSMGS